MRDSFIFYRSFAESIKELEPDVRLECYEGLTDYALNDKEPCVSGIASAMFKAFKPQIDANNRRFENGLKGGAPIGNQNAKKQPKNNQKQPKNNQKQPKNNQKQPNVNVNVNENVNVNDNDNENVNVKVNDNISSLNPPKGIDAMIDEADLSDSVKEGIQTWVRYKKEQFRFTYKPTGFKALLSEIKDKEPTLGDNGILEAINKSMSKGYKGIIWNLVNTSTGSPYMQAIKDRVNVVDSWR